MTHQSLIGWLVALALFGAGCVDRVPLDETPCPCAPGWVCDKSGGEPGVCVKTATADSGTDQSGGGDSATGVLSTAIRFVAETDSYLWSVAIVGDLDGDGLEDIVMTGGNGGVPTYSAYLYYGRKQFSAVNSVAKADAIFRDAMKLGEGLGDLDGDGLADLAFKTKGGGVHLFYGSTKRLAGEIQSTAAGVLITAPTKDGWYQEVVGAGDVNGDGLDDLLLVEELTGAKHTAYLVYGSKTRLPATYSPVNASVVFAGTDQDTLARGAGSAGDADGDGFSDLVLALGPYPAKAGLFYGRAGWQSPVTPAGADAVFGWESLEGRPPGDLGRSPGDLDGDGYDDLVLPRCIGCEPGSGSVESSNVLLFYGGKQRLSGTIGPAEADCTLLPESDSHALALAAGDLNGDGKLDIVVGDPFHPTGEHSQGGALYVLPGGPGRLPSTIQLGPDRAVAYGNKTVGVSLGRGVASGGDVNGDGFDDVLVGYDVFQAPRYPFTIGNVYLLLGGPQFPPSMP